MEHKTVFTHKMGTFSLMMTGITSIIGSGWLLATQKIANLTGPAGMLTWVGGMIIAMLIASFALEIGINNPSAGGLGAYSTITHGKFSGFITLWINWLSVLPVPAVEAQAITQYISNISPTFNQLYNVNDHTLTTVGILVTIILVIFFTLINYYSLKLFTRINNLLTIIKILIPLLTIGFLIYLGLHPANFGSNVQEFAPFGFGSIATAIISCGVIMSFNGFQLPLNFSEEIQSPKKQLPIAIFGSIFFCFLIYVVLQVTFIGSINPNLILKGWHNINFRSPYVDLMIIANLQVMAWTIMSAAVVGPAACGSSFAASSSRILFTIAKHSSMPNYIGTLDRVYRSPRRALIINCVLGCLFLVLFSDWAKLVAVISVLHVFSYISVPVVAVAYRKINNDKSHAFRLPLAWIIAPFTIFVLSVLLFYSAWPHIGELAALLIPALGFFYYYEYKHPKKDFWLAIKQGAWMFYYLALVCIVAYLGNNKVTHHNMLNEETAMILLAIISFSSFVYGVKTSKDKLD